MSIPDLHDLYTYIHNLYVAGWQTHNFCSIYRTDCVLYEGHVSLGQIL